MLRRLLTILLAAAASFAVMPSAYAIPVVEPVAADPSILRAPDGTFYMYTTADDRGDGEGVREMSIFSSDDLVDWEEAGTVFSDKPDWANGGLWAPDVHLFNDQYYVYYSVGGSDNPCIGRAVADAPTGPFQDLGHPVFCAHDIGIDGTIDPNVSLDNGTPTVFVGNFKGIYAVPLNAEGTAPTGEPIQVADDRFEAPYVVQRGGYYYLFLSEGNCCRGPNTAYRVVVGRSTSLTGPYVDRKGTDLRSGGGALVLAGNDKYAGPGHNSVISDDAGTDWIVYHAMDRSEMELPSGDPRRLGMIDKLEWANGWPEVGDGSPSVREGDLPVVHQRAEEPVGETGGAESEAADPETSDPETSAPESSEGPDEPTVEPNQPDLATAVSANVES